jgi:anti-sigma B factor antagonist
VSAEAESFRPPRFDVVSEPQPGGGTLLRLSGELDLVGEPVFEQALADVAEQPIRIDLSELDFMDSTGLRALLTAARAREGLTLSGPLRTPIRRLLELTQTLELLPFQD